MHRQRQGTMLGEANIQLFYIRGFEDQEEKVGGEEESCRGDAYYVCYMHSHLNVQQAYQQNHSISDTDITLYSTAVTVEMRTYLTTWLQMTMQQSASKKS